MKLRDLFRRKALTASPAVVEALQDRRVNFYPPLGGTNQRVSAAYQRGIDASYGWIYATQPAVRSVIDYIARNAAQLPLKLYERVDETDRERRRDHPAAESLANPDGSTPGDAFIYRLFIDYLIWDNAYVLKFRAKDSQKLTLVRLPPNGVTVAGGRFSPDVFTVWRYDGTYFAVRPEDMLHWFGYNPDDPLLGLSKLETLRSELASDRAIQTTLVELAKSGLKGGYIKRPLEAPEWSQEDAERFAEQFRAQKMRSDGRDPILDEGMEWEQTGIAPKDAELLSSRKFTKAEVASLYGVPLGAIEGENLDETRKLVYADVLPPITKALASVLDRDVLVGEYGAENYYFEFDMNDKLRGDLASRFPAMTSAAGRPWMTVNEVRARENLPEVEEDQGDGDALTIPLNVQIGGQKPALPAPNVMPPQDPNKPPQDGSHREEDPKAIEAPMAARLTEMLLRLYKRQEGAFSRHKFDIGRFKAEVADEFEEIAHVEREKAEALSDQLNEAIVEAKRREGYEKTLAEARRRAPELAALLERELTGGNGAAVDLKGLDVPEEMIWRQAGFTPEEVDDMRAMKHREALLDASRASIARDH